MIPLLNRERMMAPSTLVFLCILLTAVLQQASGSDYCGPTFDNDTQCRCIATEDVTFTDSVYCGGKSGIRVYADNVTVNFGSYTLSGSSSTIYYNTGVSIIERQNVNLLGSGGGGITGFNYAISTKKTNGVTVKGMVLKNNRAVLVDEDDSMNGQYAPSDNLVFQENHVVGYGNGIVFFTHMPYSYLDIIDNVFDGLNDPYSYDAMHYTQPVGAHGNNHIARNIFMNSRSGIKSNFEETPSSIAIDRNVFINNTGAGIWIHATPMTETYEDIVKKLIITKNCFDGNAADVVFANGIMDSMKKSDCSKGPFPYP